MDMKPKLGRQQRLSASRTELALVELTNPVVGGQILRKSSAHLSGF